MTADEQAPSPTDDLLPRLAACREEGRVVSWPGLGAEPALMVTRYTDAAAMLTDPRMRCDHRAVGGAQDFLGTVFGRLGLPPELDHLARGLLNRDGADHMRLRKLVSRAFSVRRVNELRPRVEAITSALLDDLAVAATTGGRAVDLVATFAYPLPVAVICELVGVPEARRGVWRDFGALLVSPDPTRMPAVTHELVGEVEDLIEARRADPADDLVTDLIRAHDGDDRLTTPEMVTMIVDLVVAGHETTARLITTSVLALLTRPDQLAILRAEPDLWPNAVHELVRTCGPLPTSSARHAAENMEIGDTAIPVGSTVLAGLLSANTDPRAYDDPETLDVRRDTGPGDGHLGFGRGPHYCLGAALARQETEVALRALFERFPTLHLADPPAETPPLGARTIHELLLRV